MRYYRVVKTKFGRYDVERCWSWWPFVEYIDTCIDLDSANEKAKQLLKLDEGKREVVARHFPKPR